MSDSPIIIALDFDELETVEKLVEQLDPTTCRLKVGKQLFTSCGPRAVSALIERGFDVFLDLKFHDIPNTVAKACTVAAELGVWMVNVHASGGREMMRAARQALDKFDNPPLLTAVTVLTSFQQSDLPDLGLSGSIEQHVLRLTKLAAESGCDGVVCSPQETPMLRAQMGPDFVTVTPGIRPSWSAKNDQIRITTPADALKNGSDYLVIGRPITAAEDPVSALDRIRTEISA